VHMRENTDRHSRGPFKLKKRRIWNRAKKSRKRISLYERSREGRGRSRIAEKGEGAVGLRGVSKKKRRRGEGRSRLQKAIFARSSRRRRSPHRPSYKVALGQEGRHNNNGRRMRERKQVWPLPVNGRRMTHANLQLKKGGHRGRLITPAEKRGKRI